MQRRDDGAATWLERYYRVSGWVMLAGLNPLGIHHLLYGRRMRGDTACDYRVMLRFHAGFAFVALVILVDHLFSFKVVNWSFLKGLVLNAPSYVFIPIWAVHTALLTAPLFGIPYGSAKPDPGMSA